MSSRDFSGRGIEIQRNISLRYNELDIRLDTAVAEKDMCGISVTDMTARVLGHRCHDEFGLELTPRNLVSSASATCRRGGGTGTV